MVSTSPPPGSWSFGASTSAGTGTASQAVQAVEPVQPATETHSDAARSGLERPSGGGARKAVKRSSHKRKSRSGWIVWPLVIALMGAGGYMTWTGWLESQVVESGDAPLPDAPDNVVEQGAPVGPDCYDSTCPVENADIGGGENGWNSVWAGEPITEMSVAGMEPGSVFVPQAKAYAAVKGTEGFSPSQYAGFLTIDVPDNPHRGFYYSGGAPLVAGAEAPARHGVTALGTHAGYDGHWGAFINIATLTGNETVWTKDWDGNVQRWQVSRVHTMWHTEFPEAYWSPEGPRTLMLTTCGGPAGEAGQYSHNVFVEAVPVELDGSKWQVAVDEERVQAREQALLAKTKPAADLWRNITLELETDLAEAEAARIAEEAAQLAAEDSEHDGSGVATFG